MGKIQIFTSNFSMGINMAQNKKNILASFLYLSRFITLSIK